MRVFLWLVVSAVPLSGASAATISAHASVQGTFPAAGGGYESADAADDQYSDTTAIDGPGRAASVRLDRDGTVLESNAELDILTGVFRTSVLARNATHPDSLSHAEGTAFETFEVRGTGSIEYQLDLTGGWDVSGLNPADPDFSALVMYGRLYIADASGAEVTDSIVRVRQSGPDAVLAGNVSERLGYVQDVSDGASYGFNTTVASMLEDSVGGGSASLAAVLSIIPGPGVTVAFGDPSFLSDSTPPAPIPLPAAGLLLLAATGGAGLLFRRRTLSA